MPSLLSIDGYSHALNMVKESVIILDGNGLIIWLNNKTELIFNTNAKELTRKPFFQLLSPLERKNYLRDFFLKIVY